MNKCAFLTLDDPVDFVIDDELAHRPLAQLGWQVTDLSWRQTAIPWSEFDAVIIRSPWDYPERPDDFMSVLKVIDASSARLANPLDIVRWNLSKTYMKSLKEGGVPIVPTLWGEQVYPGDFPGFLEELGAHEMVIKPVVGANGVDAFRVSARDDPVRLESIADCHDGSAFMVQPFMSSILSEGEYSLFYFNGLYSHAILKTPAPGEFRSQEERGSTLMAIQPEAALLARANQAMELISTFSSETLLYARLDFVRDASNDFLVMEAELIEPSLYLRMDAGAPMRFALAVDDWYRRGGR